MFFMSSCVSVSHTNGKELSKEQQLHEYPYIFTAKVVRVIAVDSEKRPMKVKVKIEASNLGDFKQGQKVICHLNSKNQLPTNRTLVFKSKKKNLKDEYLECIWLDLIF